MDMGQAIVEHLPALHSYALSLTRDVTASGDLVNDCVVRALMKQHLFEEGTNLRAWLFTLLYRAFINNMRKERRWLQPSEIDDTMSQVPDSGTPINRVMLNELNAGIEGLSPMDRRMVAALYDGMTYEEIAESEGIPIGTVKSRAHRARQHLLEYVE